MLKFKGKGLFVFSDPGGAKAVLAQVDSIKDLLSEFKIISDRQYAFYKDFGLPVIQNTDFPEKVIQQMQPDFIFTGTSYTSTIELEYLKAARLNGIISYSFIDHWTFLKKRFLYDKEYVFPDSILVIDKKAKMLAIDEGIDESIIEIFNNPYYLYIEKWKPSISKMELLEKLEIINIKSKIVVFAPDPLSNINGMLDYGFDEISATKIISKMLQLEGFNFNLILKAHPNQNMEILRKAANDKIKIVGSEIDNNALMFYADMIIGFFSNFLIEASIMKKKILRLHLIPVENDPIAELKIGKVVNESQLITELQKIVNGA